MIRVLQILCLVCTSVMFGQNIQVDSDTYSPQQLIEDILIDSDCIENVVVTNVVGGDFDNTDQSYGYFNAVGTTFPFQSGLVLSTGRLANTEGPNNSLSDDDAPGWSGDLDLETILDESNTHNATILEFDFTSVASQISFRYIFASEEYQDNVPGTCQYSDLFGFLIRPDTSTQYTNIALVPGTDIPVKVTTVHPEIVGSCPAENEAYFGSYNGTVSPINFNGQTAILTATANVIPNQVYHVKLVIADEQNFRYDSAVFLEAGSFQLSTDLGPDRLLATNNALCGNETYELDATEPGISNFYKWFKDGIELVSETNPTYVVSEAGTYNVEVTLDNDCIAYGNVVIEYAVNPIGFDSILMACDQNQDGLTYYDLYNAETDLTNNDDNLIVTGFYIYEADAIDNIDNIVNTDSFENSSPFQTIFARIENQAGCFDIADLELHISNNSVIIQDLEACDGDIIDGFAIFNLSEIGLSIQSQIPLDATVSYFETEEDAFSESNTLPSSYQNITENTQTIFVKINSNNQCFAISTANLNVLYTPVLLEDEFQTYCLNYYPEPIRLYGGVQNDSPSNYYYEWLFNGSTTSVDTSFNDINEAGVYTVIVTDPNGCSSSRIITVSASNIATIEGISVVEATVDNTITVQVSGEGFYDYALDDADGFYQESNIFTNVSPGFHTVYVRDRNGCGIIEHLVAILGFPKYFTPNGDTIHDTWKVYGVNSDFNQDIDIKIFNRYGQLMANHNHLNNGWDGTFNGNNLPSDDYWYVINLKDGRTFRGHFALVR